MSPFSPRALIILFTLGGVSLVAALVFAFTSTDPTEVPDHRANGHSRSAIGHSAAVALLRELEIPVVLSYDDSVSKASLGNGTLVVAEPDLRVREGVDARERVRELLHGPPSSLFVLPKRTGRRAADPAWLGTAELIPLDEVDGWLPSLGCNQHSVVRRDGVTLDASVFGAAPDVQQMQLIRCDVLEPILASDEGILVGAVRDTGIVVLADPDLMANHGLGRGDNAVVLVGILDHVRGEGGLIFDETLHGGHIVESLRHEALRPPLVFGCVALLLGTVILLWAATARFGKPVPRPEGLAAGKRLLIENTAALVRAGGHTSFALGRYLAHTVQAVAQRTHAPPDLAGPRLNDWLEQIGAARGVSHRLGELEATVAAVADAPRRHTERRGVEAARRIAQWRREMTEERS